MKGKINNSPTLYQISTLEEGFNLLNKHFFENKLPRVIINQQHKKSHGYFSPNKWNIKGNDSSHLHEINLAPSYMNCSDEEIVATLLHELCHLWQHLYGKAPCNGYHNNEWTSKMLSVGLKPVSIDNPGKMTGQKVTHEIIEGGSFDTLVKANKIKIKYYTIPAGYSTNSPKKNKIKYTCSACEAHVWGKPGLNLVCGSCENRFEETGEKEKTPTKLYRTKSKDSIVRNENK